MELLEELKAMQESGEQLYQATDDVEVRARVNKVLQVITEAVVEVYEAQPDAEEYLADAVVWVREELGELLVQEGAMSSDEEVEQRRTLPYTERKEEI